jgi:hypothetical protein
MFVRIYLIEDLYNGEPRGDLLTKYTNNIKKRGNKRVTTTNNAANDDNYCNDDNHCIVDNDYSDDNSEVPKKGQREPQSAL